MEAIVNNLIKAIGWSILHSLWQGAIIFAVLFILLSVKTKVSAKLRHNFSIVALFATFTSFCFTFASLFNLPKQAAGSSDTQLTNEMLLQFYNLSNNWSFKTERYFPIIVALYVLGIGFQLTVLISGYVKLKKLKKSHIAPIPSEWLTVAAQTVAKLGISKKIQFYLSDRVNVPVALGFLKPVVLFPVALVAQLDIKQVEAILIHELSHIRRNDYVLNLIKTGIETVLFFNPFVWLISRFIHIEREHACDDLVVNFTGEPVTYAHALLKLELIKDKMQPALCLAATGKNQHLYQRIKRITNMKTNYMNAKQKILALCLTLATVISLAWINPTKNEIASVKTTKANLRKLLTSAEKPSSLVCLADTDTVKNKIVREIVIKNKDGKRTVYQSLDEMPDSVRERVLELDKKFNSPEWKEHIAKIELRGKELDQQFNSPEWKRKMAKIELDAKKMEKKFNSPEWKEKMAKMELNAEEMAKKFNSPEWKAQMAKIELIGKELDKKFNSPEWKEHIAKIELNAKEMEKKFNSPEWKAKMDQIELQGRELDKKFNSPEWKEKMKKIELDAKKMEQKLNSPEWKKKMKDIEELRNSPEYKELQEKYEKDLEQLKKKKGISSDKAFLLLDSSLPIQITNLPMVALAPVEKVFVTSPTATLNINPTVDLNKTINLQLFKDKNK
ncbi:M56 family metallopeptidase [Nubsella zeaxanthinifaciens]|uniref:M56 family metallopeptidase n=1 Tax=Nubsella zeaxanthinifaciens TaxID=392412 RepID=UPI003D02D610